MRNRQTRQLWLYNTACMLSFNLISLLNSAGHPIIFMSQTHKSQLTLLSIVKFDFHLKIIIILFAHKSALSVTHYKIGADLIIKWHQLVHKTFTSLRIIKRVGEHGTSYLWIQACPDIPKDFLTSSAIKFPKKSLINNYVNMYHVHKILGSHSSCQKKCRLQ